jgi:glycosyltransferase involved in cell wall biosynthesis
MTAANPEKCRRILVICNDGDYFLRHRRFVVDRLVAAGAEVTVLAGGKPIAATLSRGWAYRHVHIERFGFAPLTDFWLMIETARSVFELKADAVHLITLKPAVFAGIVSSIFSALFAYPKRILITLPGLGRMLASPKRPGERTYPIATAITLSTLRLIAKGRDVQFTFETKHDFDFWRDKGVVNATNGTIVNGAGVDFNTFYPAEPAPSCATKRVLFAGRLLKSKGLGTFLTVAGGFANRPDVEFLVAGMSDDRDPDSIQASYLAGLSEIRYLGVVEDMPNLLRDCDIVCLPTRYGEGIPRILIEAAASGLASIASSHAGCLEIVVDGVTGRILSGQSEGELVRELSAAIHRYLEVSGLLDQQKRAAHRHFLSRDFNQDAIATHFCRLLGVEG